LSLKITVDIARSFPQL